jgi:hypothetical protein
MLRHYPVSTSPSAPNVLLGDAETPVHVLKGVLIARKVRKSAFRGHWSAGCGACR